MSFPVGQMMDAVGNAMPEAGNFRPAPGQPQGVMIGQPGFGLPPGDANLTSDPYANYGTVPGDSQPGMGGKSGVPTPVPNAPGMGGKAGGGGPFAQIPIDMNGNIIGQGANLPQTPPMMAPQAGTPGRPFPTADFTPAGPGFANPGAGGVTPAPQPQVPAQGNRPVVGLPGGTPQDKFGMLRPAPVQVPTPAPIVNPRARVSRQPVQTMKQGGMGRGAGRGGLLR